MDELLLSVGLLAIVVVFARLQHEVSFLNSQPESQAHDLPKDTTRVSNSHFDSPDVGGSRKASPALTLSSGLLAEKRHGDVVGLGNGETERVSPASGRNVKTGGQNMSERAQDPSLAVQACRSPSKRRGDHNPANRFVWEFNSGERASIAHTTAITEQGLTPKTSRREPKKYKLERGHGHDDGLRTDFGEKEASSEFSHFLLSKKSNARPSIECSSKGGGSSGGTKEDPLSSLDAADTYAPGPEEAFNGALDFSIKPLTSARFVDGANASARSSVARRNEQPESRGPILNRTNRYGCISDRDEEYEGDGSQAGRSAVGGPLFPKLAQSDAGPGLSRWQQHGDVFVPFKRTVVRATLQLALDQTQVRSDQCVLAQNLRTYEAELKPELKVCRAEQGARNDFPAYVQETFRHGNATDGDEEECYDIEPCGPEVVGKIGDEQDTCSVPSRVRRLENDLLQGRRLQRISGTDTYMMFGRFVGTSTNMDESGRPMLFQPDRVRMQEQAAQANQERGKEVLPEEPRTATHLVNSRDEAEVLDRMGDEVRRRKLKDRRVVYDAPWLKGARRICSEVFAIPFTLKPPTNLATPAVSEDGSDTEYEALDDSIRYSPSVKEYRKAQLHRENLPEKVQPSKSCTPHLNSTSKQLQSLSDTMKQRTSRQERMSRSQLQTQNYSSIFELAKTAQARVRGIDDPFLVTKKQRQYVEIARIEEYEPSSPSDSSDAEGWLSDLSDDVRDTHEDECKSRAAHRAAALAMLEGRAPAVEDLQPIFRSARMDYDDHVEAEHGQLHTWVPKPVRPANRIQSAIKNWDEQLFVDDIETADDRLFGLGITIPDQAGASDVLDWLNSDSPVDLLNGRPVFYYQPNSQVDEFWNEMSLEELNAESITALPHNVVEATVARRVERCEWNATAV